MSPYSLETFAEAGASALSPTKLGYSTSSSVTTCNAPSTSDIATHQLARYVYLLNAGPYSSD